LPGNEVVGAGQAAGPGEPGAAVPGGAVPGGAVPGAAVPGGAVPGARLLELVAVMDRLRSQCPWDAEQTHESLAPYLLEETYEALEALDSGDAAALREELGDVLLQVVFHARLAAERADGTGYTIDDVADGITAKMKRRHPHVFGDVTVTGPGQVSDNWNAIKAAERAASGTGPASAFDGVPLAQPALSLATALQRRAERAGVPAELADFAVPVPAPGPEPGSPEAPGQADDPSDTGNLNGTVSPSDAGNRNDTVSPGSPGNLDGTGRPSDTGNPDDSVSAIGAELFALAARARQAGLDPELELRSAARVFRERVQAWERASRAE
jgi:XTP/dITP diphosphohydrolase